MSRLRSWCFTLNNWTTDQRDAIKELDCVYLIFGEEDQGTPHLQGFVSFKNAKTLSAVAKLLFKAHVEVKRGTFKQASDYCRKEAEIVFEKGVLPLDQDVKGNDEKLRWTDALQCVQEDRIDDMDPQILCTHLAKIEYAVERIAQKKRKIENLDETDNWWVYGPHHTGKSTWIDTEFPGNYRKDVNSRNWDDYADQDVIYYEDVDTDFARFGGDLKRQAQKQPFPIKQIYKATRLIRPKRIVVSSNYHPMDIWCDPKMLDPIIGRFQFKNMTEVFPRAPALSVPPSGLGSVSDPQGPSPPPWDGRSVDQKTFFCRSCRLIRIIFIINQNGF